MNVLSKLLIECGDYLKSIGFYTFAESKNIDLTTWVINLPGWGDYTISFIDYPDEVTFNSSLQSIALDDEHNPIWDYYGVWINDVKQLKVFIEHSTALRKMKATL